MRTFASVVVAYLLAAAVLWAAFGWIVHIGRRCGIDALLASCVGLIGLGMIGYLAFFIYVLSPTIGLVCSVLVCAGMIASLRWLPRLEGAAANLPFVLVLLFGLVYLSILFLWVQQKVPGLPNDLFFESVRAGDNNISMAFAHLIYKRVAAGTVGEWYFSDRPPLQAGFELLFTPLRGLFGNDDAHQAVGTLLQTSVIAALWLLGTALRFARKEMLLAVLTLGGSGFVFYNSVFVWPKLLAATFFLVALVPLGRAFLDRRRLRRAETLVLAAASALAMLSHGAIAFSLLALSILLAAVAAKFFSPRTFVLAAITAATLYAPWAGYARFIDPNQDRLLKLHLTGGDDRSTEPFASMLVRSYRDITFERWLSNRLENLKVLFGAETVDRIAFETAARIVDPGRPRHASLDSRIFAMDASKLSGDSRSLMSIIRTDQREHVFRAFALLNLAWPTLLLLVRRRWREKLLDPGLLALLALNAMTFLVWDVIEFNPGATVITHASFAMVVIGMLTAVLLLYRTSATLARWVCYANIAVSFIIWVACLPGPSFSPPPGINWLALLVGIAGLAGIILVARERHAVRPAANSRSEQR